MEKNKDFIINTIKELKNTLKKEYKVKNIGLFGSYVKNEQKKSSDIDFLVEFEDSADLIHFIGLSRYLREGFNTNVDIISKSSVKEDLKQHILQEVIYE